MLDPALEVGRGIGRLEVAPALERPVRCQHHGHQLLRQADTAAGALLVGRRLQIDDRLAHLHEALDDPVERPAVEDFVTPLRHHARDVPEPRRLQALALRDLLLVPVAQLLDRVDADAQFNEMQRHGIGLRSAPTKRT